MSEIITKADGTTRPCPELLTGEEAAQYLRLDVGGHANPLKTLEYYRGKQLLKGTRVGRCLRYRRIELERFLDKLTGRA